MGRVLLAGQVVALIAGFVAIALRWEHLDDLGRRAARRFPLRSALSSAADVVPEGGRDALFGSGRDASHLHGLLVALVVLLIAILVCSKVVARGQKAATGAYLAGREDLRAPGWLLPSAGAALGLGIFIFWAASSAQIREVPTRIVRVHPASITQPSRFSPGTTVRFEPVGTGDDTPVVVKVGDGTADVELDAEIEYRITATASGGKDCTVSLVPGDRRHDLTVTCAAVGTPLPPVTTVPT